MTNEDRPLVGENHPDFQSWRLFFCENDTLLWPTNSCLVLRRVMARAQKLKEPIEAAHRRDDILFELDAWIDYVTDNILLKVYLRENMNAPVGQRGPEYGLARVISRSDITDIDIDDTDAVDAMIMPCWDGLVTAIWQRPIDIDGDRKLLRLREADRV